MYQIRERHVELQEGTGRWWTPDPQRPFGILEDGFDGGHETNITSR
jgi:hypothetical protein